MTKEKATRGERPASFGSKSFLPELPVEFSRLLDASSIISLKKGQTLFEAGDPSPGCYWINEGALKITVASDRGTERILAIRGPGSIIGGFALFDGLPRSASGHALKSTTLTFVTRSAFLECMHASPSLYGYLVTVLIARLRHAQREVAVGSFLSNRARIARAFLEFAEHLGEPTTTPDQYRIRELRQEDVAALAYVARENVSRTLSEWKKRGLIEREPKAAYVFFRSSLEREAGHL